VGVALVAVLAMVAAGCGSTGSTGSTDSAAGAKENATSAGWNLELLNGDGTAIETETASDGSVVPRMAVNRSYQVRSTVSPEVFATLGGQVAALQYRQAGGAWATAKTFAITQPTGQIQGTFNQPQVAGTVDYQLALVNSDGTPAASGFTSETLSAVSDLEFTITIQNITNNNLNIQVPLSYNSSTQAYNTGEFPLDQGESRTLRYVNPPTGAAVHFLAHKQQCLLGCTDYIMNWGYASTGMTACSDVNPQFTSAGAYTVTLQNPPSWTNAEFAVASLSGPLAGLSAAPH